MNIYSQFPPEYRSNKNKSTHLSECFVWLPELGEQEITIKYRFLRSDVSRCEQNEQAVTCDVMRHKSRRAE